jgi:hypothetical protein
MFGCGICIGDLVVVLGMFAGTGRDALLDECDGGPTMMC